MTKYKFLLCCWVLFCVLHGCYGEEKKEEDVRELLAKEDILKNSSFVVINYSDGKPQIGLPVMRTDIPVHSIFTWFVIAVDTKVPAQLIESSDLNKAHTHNNRYVMHYGKKKMRGSNDEVFISELRVKHPTCEDHFTKVQYWCQVTRPDKSVFFVVFSLKIILCD